MKFHLLIIATIHQLIFITLHIYLYKTLKSQSNFQTIASKKQFFECSKSKFIVAVLISFNRLSKFSEEKAPKLIWKLKQREIVGNNE